MNKIKKSKIKVCLTSLGCPKNEVDGETMTSRLGQEGFQITEDKQQADVLILTDVYAAGEKPVKGVSGKALFEEIQQYGHKCITFEPDLQKIPKLVSELVEAQDIIIIMGAGSIYKSIPEIIANLGGS